MHKCSHPQQMGLAAELSLALTSLLSSAVCLLLSSSWSAWLLDKLFPCTSHTSTAMRIMHLSLALPLQLDRYIHSRKARMTTETLKWLYIICSRLPGDYEGLLRGFTHY